MSEAQLQTLIVDYLRLRGWVVLETYKGSKRGGSVWHTKGMPDVYAVRNGRSVWLEVKTREGRVGPEQKAVHEALRNAGVECYVVRSLEEVQRLVE